MKESNVKKCPFRKDTYVYDYKNNGNGHPLVNTHDNFLECIQEKCMAWVNGYESAGDCRLMMKPLF